MTKIASWIIEKISLALLFIENRGMTENGSLREMNLCMLLLYANAKVFVSYKAVARITDATISRLRCWLWNVFLLKKIYNLILILKMSRA